MSIHVCECEHNGRTEYHLRYPGMSEQSAQNIADKINSGALDAALTQPAQPAEGGEAVATVESWTSGSYWRNYKLTWHHDVPAGTKLYTAPPASQEQAAWCEYVAGMVEHWIGTKECASMNDDADRRTKAIAGIIERRLWALKREASQEQAS